MSSVIWRTFILLVRWPSRTMPPSMPIAIRVSRRRPAVRMSLTSSGSTLTSAPLTMNSTCRLMSVRIDHIMSFCASVRVRGLISTR
ncbi:hypothetical protein G6F31_021572 [Rhizopus arrhizus]|nr:hypothetical protein G6F31_021572 [Rhizopus arrhizus]